MRTAAEVGWRITSQNGGESVLGPDLMLVTPEEYEEAVRSGDYFRGKPAIVIEVISSSERKKARFRKIDLNLEAGAGAVVEVHFAKGCAVIYGPDEAIPEIVKDRLNWPFEADLKVISSSLK